jgi:CAAX prenyl protease-like protein
MGNESSETGMVRPSADGRPPLLQRQPWLVFLFPFIVFIVVTGLEPTRSEAGGADIGLAIPYEAYPWVYTAKIVLTVIAVAVVVPGYRPFPLRVHPLAPAVGVLGAFLWVGLCKLGVEEHVWATVGWESVDSRSGYNPFEQPSAHWAFPWSFLFVRFFGLIVVVPLVEEFFLRGFVMRFFVDARWWEVPFGKVNAAAVVAGTVFPLLTHPGEMLAAAVWFSMVTCLMIRTRNLWDCVIAHAVTNLLLGLYAIIGNDWALL